MDGIALTARITGYWVVTPAMMTDCYAVGRIDPKTAAAVEASATALM